MITDIIPIRDLANIRRIFIQAAVRHFEKKIIDNGLYEIEGENIEELAEELVDDLLLMNGSLIDGFDDDFFEC